MLLLGRSTKFIEKNMGCFVWMHFNGKIYWNLFQVNKSPMFVCAPPSVSCQHSTNIFTFQLNNGVAAKTKKPSDSYS